MPFGFAFGHRNDLVISEAGASTVSSYRLGDSGLDTITASLPVGFGAACWVAVSPNGRFAYTVNNDDNTVSVIDAKTFTVSATPTVGRSPTAMAVLPDGTQGYVSNLDDGTLTEMGLAG